MSLDGVITRREFLELGRRLGAGALVAASLPYEVAAQTNTNYQTPKYTHHHQLCELSIYPFRLSCSSKSKLSSLPSAAEQL